jgi:integrase
MAVYKSKDAFRVKPWCSDTYKGSTRVKRYFESEREAKEYEATQTLSPVSKSGWNKIKVSSLVERYRDEITPTKPGYKKDNPKADPETNRLNNLLNKKPGKVLCGYALSDLVEYVQAWEYIRARERQTTNRGTKLTPRTISRERNLLQDVFRIAKEEWGYAGLNNPFAGLKIKGSKFKRTRRLEFGEYEKLIEHSESCHGLNKRYVALAIDIAIETAMREQEVLNLEWRDIDFDRRTITIRKSKMDYKQDVIGRRIVLPYHTMIDLVCLKEDIECYGDKGLSNTDRIFPMTQDALIQAFERTVERAGIKDLVYADLRREATSRWGDKEPSLTTSQMKLMDGHSQSDNDINTVYNIPALKEIRLKLDKQAMGMTFEEKYKVEIDNGWRVYDIIKEKYWFEMPVVIARTEMSAHKAMTKFLIEQEGRRDLEKENPDRFKFLTAISKFNEKGIYNLEDEKKQLDEITKIMKEVYGDGPYTFEQEAEKDRIRTEAYQTSPKENEERKRTRKEKINLLVIDTRRDTELRKTTTDEPVKTTKIRPKPRDPNWTVGSK